MTRVIPIFLMICAVGTSFGAGLDASNTLASASDRMREMVQTLTAPDLAGRASGSVEAGLCAEWLASWMQELGLEPGFDQEFIQRFALTGQAYSGESLAGHQGFNVAGILPGRGTLASQFVVVGAHFDHLGRLKGSPKEGPPEAEQYYPGANDNASGLAVLRELAQGAVTEKTPANCRSLLIVCFGAEEVGLQGSGYFVAQPPVPLDRISAMINFDTVGQMTDRRLHVSGVGTAAELPGLVAQANTTGLDLSLAQGGWSGSDHMSFNTREIPVLFVFGGPYKQYNTPQDTWDTLNYQAMDEIAGFSGRVLQSLRILENEPAWVMVAAKDLRETDGPQDRRSWLGTLPDFTEEISGYKLAGVFDNSPAALAGLLKGDVMTVFAGQEVTDLATFTRALRSHSPGDLVEITVIRDGSPLNFTVALGDRKNRK